MTARATSTFNRRLLLAVGLTVACIASAQVGLALIVAADGAAPLWTANGFLAAAVLLLPRRWSAPVFAVCFLAQIGLGALRQDPVLLSMTLSAVNMGEALLVAVLARRALGRSVRLTNFARVARLLGLAVLPAAAASAAVAAAAQATLLHNAPLLTFVTWFASDALGMALVLPALLLARNTVRDFRRPVWEHVAIYSVLAMATVTAFEVKGAPLHFLLFPMMLLAAFRLGPRGAGYAMLMLTAITVTLIAWAPGVSFNPDWSMAKRMRVGQFLIATIFVTSLATALAIGDQARLKRLWVARSSLATRSQARALAASKAKAEFLATMSHEIRTPMNSILGFTEVLLRRPDLPDTARAQLGLIDQAGASLLVVVNDILDFSKMEAGEIELQRLPSAPLSVAEAALAIVADTARAKGLEVAIETSGDVGARVLIDELRVRQILLNLLTNAVKFTDAGEIRLHLEIADHGADSPRLRFTVADTGVGVAADKLERLFKRFSQADSSVSRAFGGTGLGLAICKGLTERMGGEIGVASTLGEGSQFWFEIPAEPALGVVDAVDAAEPVNTAGIRVLLVDDHPMNRELGATILGLLGCDVALADSGEQAITMVKSETFDVILMDIHMPHMDGWETTGAICALGGQAAQTPIIALSADVMPETAARCLRAGMVDVAAKPIRIDELHAVLSRWVGGATEGSDEALHAA